VDLNTPIISKIIDNWIDEDIGSGDLTSSSITEDNGNAYLIAKEECIFCGVEIIKEIFRKIDLKFSPKNSTLIIRAYTWPDSCPAFPPINDNDGAPQCELVSPLPKVRIEIADTGSGISQADQEKIFDRFYRVENAVHTEQGTGLGLSIVRGIIEKHGGEIRMASELGVGTTFWFDLALAQSDKDELLTQSINKDNLSNFEVSEII